MPKSPAERKAAQRKASAHLVRNISVRKKVQMWFPPHALDGKVDPSMKILFWNMGDYYGRFRENA